MFKPDDSYIFAVNYKILEQSQNIKYITYFKRKMFMLTKWECYDVMLLYDNCEKTNVNVVKQYKPSFILWSVVATILISNTIKYMFL